MIKNITIIVIAVVVLTAGVALADNIFNIYDSVVNTGDMGNMGDTEESFGALSGPDIMSPYISVGGVRSWYSSMELRTGSTTPCALQSPNGTSTLTYFHINFKTTSTSASTIEIAKSETAFATTTLLSGSLVTLADSTNQLRYASTTLLAAQGVDNNSTFGDEEWVVVKMTPTTATKDGTMSPTGKCAAIWRSVE